MFTYCMKNFLEWLLESTHNIHIDLSNYESEIKDEIHSYDYSEEDENRYLKELIQKTQDNMLVIKNKIESAINNISSWSTNTLTIQAMPSYSFSNNISLEPAEDASIIFGTEESAPNFSLFHRENEIHIDDVLEGGDREFFKDQSTQNDYFTLIDELRNLGKQRKYKILTLYTARPKRDRQQLLTSQTLPINVFLTDDEEHAYGLAHDLSDEGETRDVWIVRINSKYLTKTLDGPIKYYQITTDDAPMDINLIS